MTNEAIWPTEVRRTNGGAGLRVTWSDGSTQDYTAEYLRVESPSAEVQGHSRAQKQLQIGKANVIIRDIIPIGNYAVRLAFDDGHSTGIYSWSYLRELAEQRETRWRTYLNELEARGFSR